MTTPTNKVIVELTPLQAVILRRLVHTSCNTEHELRQTQQWKFIINGKCDGLSAHQHSPLDETKVRYAWNNIYSPFDDALTKAKVNNETFTIEKPIIIAEHVVQFNPDGINVGCQHITHETIRAIAKRAGII